MRCAIYIRSTDGTAQKKFSICEVVHIRYIHKKKVTLLALSVVSITKF